MDPRDQYTLVVTAIEYDDFTIARYLCVHAPQEIVVEFFGSWDPKARHSHTLRIDSIKDTPDGAVFAAGIHPLENNQHLVFVFGIEHLLKLFHFTGQFL